MYIEFTDSTLGALVMSKAAFEATYGHNYTGMLMCVQVLGSVRRIADLLSLTCLQVLTVALVGGGTAVAVTHRPTGLGLQFSPLDADDHIVARWGELADLDAEAVSVSAVLGVAPLPVPAAAR